VATASGRRATATEEGGTAVLDEPHGLQTILEPAAETYLEIIDASSGHRVVTVIEVLSPTKKLPGPGQEMYLTKQKEMKQGDVNLVEIDLVRQGERVTSVPGKQQPPHLQSLYQVCVWRPHRSCHEIYPIPLGVRLPNIRVPLRPKDDDVRLDLQAVLDQAIAMAAISQCSTIPSRYRRRWIERMLRAWRNC
jgi:hypothetical protein